MAILGEENSGAFELEVDSEHQVKVLSVSDYLVNLHGFDETDLKSPEGWRATVGLQDQATVEAIIRQLASGIRWVGRVRIQTKTGERLILEIDADAEKSSNGTVLVHGQAKNVTDQAELEAALKREDSKLRLLSERIPVALWSTDKELRATWELSPGLEKLDLHGDQFVGVTLQEYFGTDDIELPPIAAHLRALGGETTTYDFVWLERSWRCWVEPSRDEVGNVNGVIGVALDLTDLAALQEEALELGRDVAHLAVATEASFFSTSDADGAIDMGALRIDLGAHRVTKEGATIRLTPTEFKLLVALGKRCGAVLERGFLLETVWGYDFAGGGSPLSMTVRRLREKIEDDPQHPTRLETIRGIGYRINAV